jgi:hypothetical protein
MHIVDIATISQFGQKVKHTYRQYACLFNCLINIGKRQSTGRCRQAPFDEDLKLKAQSVLKVANFQSRGAKHCAAAVICLLN